MNYYLTAQASEDFHPEFYVTVATVLPLAPARDEPYNGLR